MKERNHTIITISTLLGMVLTVLALLAFVWRASAQNSKFETACSDVVVIKPVVAKLTTDVEVLKKDIVYIVDGIDDLKRASGLVVRRKNIDPNQIR